MFGRQSGSEWQDRQDSGVPASRVQWAVGIGGVIAFAFLALLLIRHGSSNTNTAVHRTADTASTTPATTTNAGDSSPATYLPMPTGDATSDPNVSQPPATIGPNSEGETKPLPDLGPRPGDVAAKPETAAARYVEEYLTYPTLETSEQLADRLSALATPERTDVTRNLSNAGSESGASRVSTNVVTEVERTFDSRVFRISLDRQVTSDSGAIEQSTVTADVTVIQDASGRWLASDMRFY